MSVVRADSDGWHVQGENGIEGPYSKDVIEARVSIGLIGPQTLVSKEGFKFSPASEYFDAKSFPAGGSVSMPKTNKQLGMAQKPQSTFDSTTAPEDRKALSSNGKQPHKIGHAHLSGKQILCILSVAVVAYVFLYNWMGNKERTPSAAEERSSRYRSTHTEELSRSCAKCKGPLNSGESMMNRSNANWAVCDRCLRAIEENYKMFNKDK